MGGPSIIHLPDGQNFTVTPVFAGLFFKSHELNAHHNSAFPIGWTVVLHTEEEDTSDPETASAPESSSPGASSGGHDHLHHHELEHSRKKSKDSKRHNKAASEHKPSGSSSDVHTLHHQHALSVHARQPRIRAYTRPTLQNDSLFISSISNPSSSDFKPAVSPTRQIAMMLWITLYWYFHQPAPTSLLPPTASSFETPENGRPRGEWRINVRRDGVLRGRTLIPKLERMGLIATLDSVVGTALGPDDEQVGWGRMFVSRRAFWQIPARLFLFTLQPNARASAGASYPGSPISSRPGSPTPQGSLSGGVGAAGGSLAVDVAAVLSGQITVTTGGDGNSQVAAAVAGSDVSSPPPPASVPSFPIGPFFSSSHLPTYYPPGPPQYTMTDGVRHPVRPKPPRMGEVFYSRFVPSAGAYLSFRVASLSPKPVQYQGAVGPLPSPGGSGSGGSGGPVIRAAAQDHSHLCTLPDTSLLQMWLAKPRVHRFWGGYVPDFLSCALASRHSFPALAMWDGVPFAYLEFYWVKEDTVGRYLGGAGGSPASDWDRGVHVLIGEEWARGAVPLWLSSAVHWLFLADYRTMSVCVEPRVDNERFIQHLQAAGFNKESEIALPHKQAWFGRLRRENWEGPAL